MMLHRSLPGKAARPDTLIIAVHMRDAIAYLAALASRSELESIARKLVGIHLDLGLQIDVLTGKDAEPPGEGGRKRRSRATAPRET